MSKPRLSDSDYCRASERLGCGPDAIAAVAEQESLGAGFDPQDRPVILFERHLFHRYTGGRFDATHPGISNPVGGGYGATAAQYGRFSEAFALDPNAAMRATSWGKFQILGDNHAICGYDTVSAFVDAMKVSEANQLDAFVAFVAHNHLDEALTDHDWTRFANGYNGIAQKKHHYDTLIAAKFAHWQHHNFGCSQNVPAPPVALAPEPIPDISNTASQDNSGIQSDAGLPSGDSTASKTLETPAAAMPEPPALTPPPVTQQTADVQTNDGNTAVTANTPVGGLKWLVGSVIAIVTGQATVPEFVTNGVQSPSFWTVVLNIFANLWAFKVWIIGGILVIFIMRKIEVTVLKVAAMRINSDDTKGNVVLTKPAPTISTVAWLRGKVGF